MPRSTDEKSVVWTESIMDGPRLTALFLLTAGHSALLVAAVNRLHGLPLSHQLLRQLRHLHDLLLLVIPGWLIWKLRTIDLAHPRECWAKQPWGIQLFVLWAGLGLLALAWSIVRYQFRRPCAQLIDTSRAVISAQSATGERPIGDGPHQWLARLPFNEQFTIELNHKTLQLPRLPRAADGLKILHLSDWHFLGTVARPFYEQATDLALTEPVDLIVFTGDLFDRMELLDWLGSTLGRLQAPLGCHFILGNHDWNLDHIAIRNALTSLGWNDVAGKTQPIDYQTVRIALGGSELPWMGQHPDFTRVPADFRILLSHTPDNLAWAQQQPVDLMLSGHNHGGQVVLPLFGPIFTPSLQGCRFSGGTFSHAPTLLHVSRGLAGKHPLRWRCRPEITVLTLRSA